MHGGRALRRTVRAGATLLLVALGALPGAAQGAPPEDPSCLALGGGSTGVRFVGGELPTPDELAGERGGFGAEAPPDVAATLPDAIVFRSATETFSREYAFAVRRGDLYVRPATVGRGDPNEP